MSIAHKLSVLAALSLVRMADASTAYQFLQQAPPPNFRAGHTLPRLTRWGWTMSFDTRQELCERWGYCLEWGGYASTSAVKALDNPLSTESKICALTASDPARYPLCVLLHRPLTVGSFIATLPESTWCHDGDGNLITNVPQWKRYSTEMPDSVYRSVAAGSTGPLARIRAICPISVVLNGGEYGLSVYGHSGPTWAQDPAVTNAKGDRAWFDYVSDRKAHAEQFVTDATLAAAPGLDLYLYYPTSGAPDRNPSSGYWTWVWDYAAMRTISTLPNSSTYYGDFNSGWTGSQDMLSQALNCTAYQISLGQPLSYNWVCGGYKTNGIVSDDAHYMGWLKCYYTAGMIGGIAGYFSYPPGGFAGDVGAAIPNWLRQMMTLGHVQALFSHVDGFLRQGDLLPGPNRHRWSTDLPAYEFPTGDSTARVLARRLRDRPEWLICAWAAAGDDRPVTVTIPDLGTVTLFARSAATLYRAKPGPLLVQLDPDGMQPSAGLHDITVAQGTNGSIFSSGNVAVPAGASETFAIIPDPGFQVADVVVDGISVGATTSYTFAAVTTNHAISATFDVLQVAPLGTPLWWLALYGWTNHIPAAEIADADGDNVPAWMEYLWGSDPTNALSRPDFNAVPYAESFENLAGWGGAYGPVFGHMGWHSGSPADDESCLTNRICTLSASNRPLPAATHTNVMRLSTRSAPLINSFGPGYAMSGTMTYVDMAVQWIPDDNRPGAWTATDTGIKCGVYANAGGTLAIFHGVAGADGTLLSNAVDDTAFLVDPTNWYRLTITIDATAANPSHALALFRVQVNGEVLTNGAAHPDGWRSPFNATGLLPPVCPSGTWFRIATTDAFAKVLTAMDLDGRGYFDDLVVTDRDPFEAIRLPRRTGAAIIIR